MSSSTIEAQMAALAADLKAARAAEEAEAERLANERYARELVHIRQRFDNYDAEAHKAATAEARRVALDALPAAPGMAELVASKVEAWKEFNARARAATDADQLKEPWTQVRLTTGPQPITGDDIAAILNAAVAETVQAHQDDVQAALEAAAQGD